MAEFNNEDLGILADKIIRALGVCLRNKEVWQTDKIKMKLLIKEDDPAFYLKYPRICSIIVNADDITPLLGMLKTLGEVQNGKRRFDDANEMITNAINAKYVDPILNSDKLVKEREGKKKV